MGYRNNRRGDDGGRSGSHDNRGRGHFDNRGDDTLIATGGDARLDGGDGDDVLIGAGGDDRLDGGRGDDSIQGGDGRNRVDAGDGNDTVTTGQDDDRIDAGRGDDLVMSGGGNDQVDAGRGDDTVDAGGGRDTVQGRDGDDSISGGDGDDRLQGDDGNDTLDGGNGDDQLDGGDGNDLLSGGAGDDRAYGGDGDDTVLGGSGDDTLHGGRGDDLVDGGDGDDVIRADRGNDTLVGGAGSDLIHGDRDDDVIRGDGDGFDSIQGPTELQQGSNGTWDIAGLDAVELSVDFLGGSAGFDNSFGYYLADASGNPVSGAIIFRNVKCSDDDAGDDVRTISLDAQDLDGAVSLGFFLLPDGGDRNRHLRDGDDVSFRQDRDGDWQAIADGRALQSAYGRDTVFFSDAALNRDGLDHEVEGALPGDFAWEDLLGGGDNDFNDATFRISVLDGPQPAFDDTIYADRGDDLVNGDRGDDFIDGGRGNDTLQGGSGDDTVAADDDDDRVIHNVSDNQGAHDTYDGGKGQDTLELQVTEAELALLADDIAAYRDVLAQDSHGNGHHGHWYQHWYHHQHRDNDRAFEFEQIGLDVRNFEALNLTIVNFNPDAVDDAVVTDEDTALLIDVLANDGDADGDALTLTAVTQPANGTVEIVGDRILFTPAENRNGPDSFTYTVFDGVDGFDTATVTLTVNPVNDAPVAADDAITVVEDTTTTIDVLANDVDVDGDVLTVIAASALNGSVTINPDSTLSYTPNGNYYGTDTISYTISDGALTSTASVAVTVTNDGTDALFTDGNDTVDFNTVTPFDLDDGNTSDALGGDDMVILPVDQATADAAGFDTGAPFDAGSGDDTVLGGGLGDSIIGGDGADSLSGNDGDDSLSGGTGADFLSGGAGDDTLDGGAGGDLITDDGGNNAVSGGEGDDTVNIDNGTGTVSGDAGDDLVVASDSTLDVSGGEGNDTLLGIGGDNTLSGGAGDDLLDVSGMSGEVSGGDGNDSISASESDAALFGGQGEDVIDLDSTSGDVFGGDGNDTITSFDATGTQFGGDGDDTFDAQSAVNDVTIDAGNGNDLAITGSGKDTIDGGDGNDVLAAGDGADLASGGTGDDLVQGQAGDDTLSGDAGDDTLEGGEGDDLLDAGDGDDLVEAGAGDDQVDAGSGNDTVNAGAGNDAAVGGSGDDLVLGEAGNDTLSGGEGDDTLDGGEDADLLSGGAGADSINAGSGKDTIDAGDDNDLVDGGDGNDSVEAGSGDDTVLGGAGNDTVSGGDGNDVVDAGTGDDTVLAGAGNDTVAGGDGDDSVEGGTGDDLILGEAGNDTLSGGEGDDTLDGGEDAELLSGGAGADSIVAGNGDDTIDAGDGSDVVDAGAGDDSVSAGVGDDAVLAGDGNDTVAAGDGDDSVEGGTGDDLVLGEAGNDTLSGGEGDDTLDGGDDADLLSGGAGADSIVAGSGDDTVDAGDDDDIVDAGDGNDSVEAGAGDDTVLGGAGNDSLSGGDGSDALDGGDGDDVIDAGSGSDVVDAGTGDDSVSAGAGDDAVQAGDGNDTVAAGEGDDSVEGGTGDDLVLGEAGNDTLSGGAGDDTLDGGDDADLLSGGTGADSIVAGSGDDSVDAGDDSDIVDAGDGSDSVEAGSGDDTVLGGAGNDTVAGGDGNDVLEGGDGDDLLDAGTGNDVVDAGSGNDTVSAGDGDDAVLGGEGNDTLSGDAGNDTLLGGAGDDQFFGGTGDDSINGGAGNDNATFTGNADEYEVTFNADGTVTITDTVPGRDGTTTLEDVETATFADETYFTDGTNNAPEASGEAATTDEDVAVTIDVLANDTDFDSDPLTVASASAANGTVEIGNDGTLTYTGNADFNGTDTISYTVADGRGGTDTAEVTVTVNAINDAPVVTTPTGGALRFDGNPANHVQVAHDPDLSPASWTIEAWVTTSDADGQFNRVVTKPVGGQQTYSLVVRNGEAHIRFDDATLGQRFVQAGFVADGQPHHIAGVYDDAANRLSLYVDGELAGSIATSGTPRQGTEELNIGRFNDGFSQGFIGDISEVRVWSAPRTAAEIAASFDQVLNSASEPDLELYLTFDPSLAEPGKVQDLSGHDFDGSIIGSLQAVAGRSPVDQAIQTEVGQEVRFFGGAVADVDAADGTGVIEVTVQADNGTIDVSSGTGATITGDQSKLVTLTGTAAQISLSLANMTFTPDAGFIGTETVTITASDLGNSGAGGVLTDTGNFTILVVEPNVAPEATDDTATVDEDSSISIDVLANDSDDNGDDLTITAASVDQGTVVIETDGTLTYTPDANFNGLATISYTITDGNGEFDTATVAVTVNPVNDAPVAVDDAATTDEDSSVSIDVLGNDSDIDGDALSVASASAANGTVVIEANGTLTYTPDADFNGIDTISYTLSDGDLTDTAEVTVTVNAVNDAPVAVNDTATTDEDTTVSIDVLGNDSDVDGDALTVTAASAANGTVMIEANGTLTYTPDADFNGIDTISYTLSDGDLTDTTEVTVTVNAVNDAPVAVDDTATTDEDSSVSIDVLGNDSDVDGDALTVTAASAANGTVVIEANGTLTYTPDADFNGTDTISYTLSDGDLTDTAEVTVTVNAVNDAPEIDVAGSDLVSDLTVGFERAESLDANDLLANFVHPVRSAIVVDEGALDVLHIGSGGISRTPMIEIPLFSAGEVRADDRVSVLIDGVIQRNGSDQDLFFGVRDSDQHMSLFSTDGTIGGLFSDAVLANGSLGVAFPETPPSNDRTTLGFGSSTEDFSIRIDLNGDADRITLLTGDGVVLNFAGDAGAYLDADDAVQILLGSDGFPEVYEIVSVAYSAEVDGLVDSGMVLFTDVDAADVHAATVTNVATTGDTNGIDAATFAGFLTLGTVTASAAGSTGSVGWTFEADDDLFAYLASGESLQIAYTIEIDDNAGGTDSETVTVNINGRNDGPVAVDDIATTDEDTTVSINVLANDSDVDGDALTVVSATANNGSVVVEANGSLTYTPDAEFSGQDTISYVLSDGELTNTAQVAVTVNPVNDAPLAVDDAATVDEDTTVVIDVLGNDSDVDGDALTVTAASAANGTVVIEADGTLAYTPDADFNGTDTISYTLSDSDLTDTAEVTVTVNAVNDAPVLQFGSSAPRIIELSDVAAGNGGFVINGNNINDLAGASIAGSGDINGDGIPDIVIGAVRADANGTDTGQAYVVFGKSDSGAINLADVISGNGGFVINGADNLDSAGGQVRGIGDINGDGLGDVIVSAHRADPNGGYSGSAHVVFGKADGTPVELSDIENAIGGFSINGIAANQQTGFKVDAAGDVNGDGFGDLLVSAHGYGANGTLSGGAFVVFGQANPSANIELSDVASGSGGFVIRGANAFDLAGLALSAAGDVNGDGLDDVIIGARGDDPNGDASGAAFVVFGKTGTGAVELSAIGAGTGGFAINGIATDDSFGGTVAGLGDVNGDGLADVFVGAATPIQTPSGANDGYVVFGKADGGTVELSDVTAGTGGFRIAGASAGDRFGYSVTAVGDINGDGLADLLVGAPGDGTNGTSTGAAYLVLGQQVGTTIDLSDPVSTPGAVLVLNGFENNGFAGYAVGSIGDLNGDGHGELLIGAPSQPQLGVSSGAAFVVFTPALQPGATTDFSTVPEVTVEEDGQATITGLAISDIDVAEGTGEVQAILAVANGTINVTGTGATIVGNGTGSVTVTGALGDVNDAIGSLTYTPDTDFNGPDSLQIDVSDLGNTGSGGPLTDSESIQITVTPVNDTPVAGDDSATTDEDTAVSIAVLDNDSDGDGDALTITAADAANGDVVIEANGTLTYTPDADFNGTDTISYSISDGTGGSATAEVTVTVNPVNDAPEIDQVASDLVSDLTVGFVRSATLDANDLLANYVNPFRSAVVVDEGTLDVLHVSPRPGSGFDRTVLVEIPLFSAGELDAGSLVSIDIDALIQRVGGDQDIAFGIRDTDQHLSFFSSDGGTGLLLADALVGIGPFGIASPENPPLTERTVPAGSQVEDFTLRIDLDGASDRITLVEGNGNSFNTSSDPGTYIDADDTVAIFIGADQFHENYEIVSLAFSAEVDGLVDGGTILFTDVDAADTHSAAVTNVATTGDTNGIDAATLAGFLTLGAVTSSVAGATGAVGWSFAADDALFDYLGTGESLQIAYTVEIDDNAGGTDSETVTVTINGRNDGPVALDDTATLDEDTSVSIDVLGNDSDVDGDALTVTAATANNGSVVVEADGSLTYTPDADFNGSDTISYVISDGELTDTAQVAVTVNSLGELIVGTNGDDSLTGFETGDTLRGLAGDDTLEGGSGNDELFGGGGVDTLIGGEGADTLDAGGGTVDYSGAQGSVIIDLDAGGGTENGETEVLSNVNHLVGSDFDDTLSGDLALNIFQGRGGNDALNGGTGFDSIFGGDGNDTIDNDGGTDTLSGDAGDDLIRGSSSAEEIFGGADNDTLDGGDGSDTMDGGDGNDVLTGGGSLDTLTGGDGDDSLSGGLQADHLSGGAGNDTLDGGGNSDTADYTGDAPGGVNVDLTAGTATDGFGGTDVLIDIETVLGSAQNDTLRGTGVNDRLVGNGGDDLLNGELGADLLEGGEGNDTLLGVGSNDTLQGGGGNDSLDGGNNDDVLSGGTGNDLLEGGAGDDIAVFTGNSGEYDITFNGDGTVTVTDTVAGRDGTDILNGVESGRFADGDFLLENINVPPVATDDSATTDEDVAVSIDVLANDSDADGDALTVTSATASNGSVVIEGDGTLTYTPDADFNGSDTISYTVTDGEFTDTAEVAVTVNPVNDAPVAADFTVPATLVSQLDTGTPGDHVSVADAPSLAIGGTGPVTVEMWINADSTAGLVTLFDKGPSDVDLPAHRIHLFDGQIQVFNFDGGLVGTAAVVTAGIDTHVAVTFDGANLSVFVNGVAQQVTTGGQLPNGSGLVAPDGLSTSYVLGPSSNEGISFGTDLFPARVFDGQIIEARIWNTARSAAEIQAGIDAPLADPANEADLVLFHSFDNVTGGVVPDLSGNGNNGTLQGNAQVQVVASTLAPQVEGPAPTNDNAVFTISGADILAGASDVDGDVLGISGLAADGQTSGFSANGAALSIVNGDITFDPEASAILNGLAAGERLTDSFTVTVSDGDGGTTSLQVSIDVDGADDGPVAADDAATTDEDVAVGIDVLGNDIDPEGDAISVTSASAGNGTVVIEANGTLTYTPDADFNGTDTISYTVEDGVGGTDTAEVSVTVNPVNDAPVGSDDAATVTEDGSVLIDAAANDGDPDGDGLSVSAVGSAANGTVAVEAGQIRYTPNADFFGSDSFSYTVSDGNGGTGTASVTVTVTPAQDAPTVAAKSFTVTDNDGTVALPLLAPGTEVPDIDGDDVDILQAEIISSGRSIAFTLDGESGEWSFDTAQFDDLGIGESESFTLSYLASDNSTPIGIHNGLSLEDTVFVQVGTELVDFGFGLVETPIFEVQDVSHFLIVDIDAGTYTVHKFNESGAEVLLPDSVPQNGAFIRIDTRDTEWFASARSYVDGVETIHTADMFAMFNYDGPTGTVTTAGIGEQAVFGTISQHATLVWTGPTMQINGATAPIEIVLDDLIMNDFNVFTGSTFARSQGTAIGTATITVDGANDPVVAADDVASVSEDGSVAIDVLANDTDPEGDTLTVTTASAANGQVVIGAGGTLTYTPDADFNGQDSISYTVEDGNGGSDTATVTVTVVPANDDPVASDDLAATDEDTPVTFAVLGNDSDVDGDSLSVSAASAANGTVIVNGDNSLTYIPDADFNGTDTVSYTVADGNGGSDTATVSVTVNPVNDAPVLAIRTGVVDTAAISLGDVGGAVAGLEIIGEVDSDRAGYAVSDAGDVNGDGIGDLIIAARYHDGVGPDSGAAYVVFGTGQSGSIDLAQIRAGNGGFAIDGSAAGDRAGHSVAGGGDINGDGLDDLVVGARLSDVNGTDSGAAYVVFGKTDGATVNLAALENPSSGQTDGFLVSVGNATQRSGEAVGIVDDMNGDGLDEVLVGVPLADTAGEDNAGKAFVVFGRAGNDAVTLADIGTGGGFTIGGGAPSDLLGLAVSGAGDVNGDGIGDFIVGVSLDDPNGNSSGSAMVVFGKADGSPIDVNALELDSNNGGFQIRGASFADQAGTAVSAAGDINGDGLDDLIVGVPNDDAPHQDSGSAFVVFGKADGVAVELSSIETGGGGGFHITGGIGNDQLGRGVSGLGDINRDGFDDVIVGAPGNDVGGADSGTAYVIFGKADTTTVNITGIEGNNGQGIVLRGALPDRSAGIDVSGIADVNGDGFRDLVVGSPIANSGGNQEGSVDVIFTPVVTSDETDFANVATINLDEDTSTDIVGLTVLDVDSGAGNVEVTLSVANGTLALTGNGITGNGTANVTITAPAGTVNAALAIITYTPDADFFGADALQISVSDLGNSGTGTALTDSETIQISVANDFAEILFTAGGDVVDYDNLLFQPDDGNLTDALGGDDFVLLPGSAAAAAAIGFTLGDTVFGGSGNDEIIGRALDDVADGGADNDRLRGEDGNDLLAGGSGNDTLEGGTGADTLQGGDGDDLIESGLGADVIDGGDGIDHVSYQFEDDAIQVDLQAGTGVGGDADGDTFAGIEQVTGGFASDQLTGDGGDNGLFGGEGDDLLFGGDGADTLDGGNGDDTLQGGNGADSLNGLSGNDTASYSLSDTGVAADLQAGQGTAGQATGDQFFDIENLVGSGFNDTLFGDFNQNLLAGGDGDDELFGNDGDDILQGGNGADVLDGGTGQDTASYATADAAVTVDLQSGTGSAGQASGDALASIENLAGSGFGDSLSGDGNDNLLAGGDGDDTLTGNGGTDTLDGGDGIDLADFANASGRVEVDLFGGVGFDQNFNNLFLSGIENVTGSQFDDNLIGNDDANLLDGGNDRDTLTGGLGDDTLLGGEGDDSIFDGEGLNFIDGGEGNDTIQAGFDADLMFGGFGDDAIDGSDGDDTLIGSFGNDTMIGGTGDDRFIFSSGDGIDRIEDFSAGAGSDDVLDFSSDPAIASLTDLIISDDGFGNTTIDYGFGDQIMLVGIAAASLDFDDFDFGVIFQANDDTGFMLNGETQGFDVLANDTGGSGTLTVIAASAARGAVVIGRDGQLTYTPDLDFFDGTDAISYTVEDQAGAQSTATLTVTVSPSGPVFTGTEGDDVFLSTAFGGGVTPSAEIYDLRGGNDVLIREPGQSGNLIIGGSGDDGFEPRDGDIYLAGDGVDSIFSFSSGGFTGIFIDGGNDNDSLQLNGSYTDTTLIGGAGNDVLAIAGIFGVADSGPINSELFGGDGDDAMRIDSGRDSFLFGGAGNDTLHIGGGEGISADGGDGDDSFRLSTNSDGVIDSYDVTGGAGNDIFRIGLNNADGVIDEVVIHDFTAGAGTDDFFLSDYSPTHAGGVDGLFNISSDGLGNTVLEMGRIIDISNGNINIDLTQVEARIILIGVDPSQLHDDDFVGF